MRCTDNKRKRRSYIRRRRRKRIIIKMVLFLFILCTVAGYLVYKDFNKTKNLAAEYEAETYKISLYEGKLYAKDLCVVSENIDAESAPDSNEFTSAALFDLDGASTNYAYNVHEKLYPASVTKILTALVALENADVSEMVTVKAGAEDFAADESVAGIKKGDQMTLDALLYGLLLHSGNDCAESIAYHVAGGIDEFVGMMNERAEELMATESHFMNPSGLHDDNHYTTAYDIYLIFNECIKNKEFVKIISTDSYTANIKGADGTEREIKWEPSHFYAHDKAEMPKSAEIVGGKTGTTQKAGSCLVLLDKSPDGNPYVSVVMGAQTKDILYKNMTTLINLIQES